jgi:hypothetical protein
MITVNGKIMVQRKPEMEYYSKLPGNSSISQAPQAISPPAATAS